MKILALLSMFVLALSAAVSPASAACSPATPGDCPSLSGPVTPLVCSDEVKSEYCSEIEPQ